MVSKIGDTMIRDGRVWRLYERELEGDKWEDIGPIRDGVVYPTPASSRTGLGIMFFGMNDREPSDGASSRPTGQLRDEPND